MVNLAAWAEGGPQAEAPEKPAEQAVSAAPQPAHSRRDKDPLKALEDALGSAFGASSSPRNSLPLPPPRPAARAVTPSKETKDLLQRRKDWVFLSPEELINGPQAKDPSKMPQYGPDGRELDQLSPMDRYILKKNAKSPASESGSLTPSSANDDSPFGSNSRGSKQGFSDTLDGAQSDPGRGNSARQRKGMGFGSWEDPTSPLNHPTITPDLFSRSDDRTLSPEQVRERNNIQAYREMLNGSSAASSPSLLNDLGGIRSPSPSVSGLPAASSLRRPDGYDPHLGRVNPTYIPTAPDVNARALNQWNLSQSIPKLDPPKTTPPLTSPNPTFPKRFFQ